MEGHTAIKRLRVGQKLVSVGGAEYVFVPKYNITLAWVKDEHIQQILAMRRTCCGNNKRVEFVLASETDVRRWNNGGR